MFLTWDPSTRALASGCPPLFNLILHIGWKKASSHSLVITTDARNGEHSSDQLLSILTMGTWGQPAYFSKIWTLYIMVKTFALGSSVCNLWRSLCQFWLKITRLADSLLSRESDTRFSTSNFFHKSVSPGLLSIPLGQFQIFSKIFISGVNDTGEKRENFEINFVESLV